MAFTSGFNPHPVMTVAMPLSVGVTSECEYMKIGFAEDYKEDEIKTKLNDAFPDGFSVLAVKKLEGKEIDFNKISEAVYETEAECNDSSLFSADAFMKNESLLVMKKSKSGVKEADIRPYIYSLSAEIVSKDKINFTMRIAAGNEYNLKVDTVIDAICKYTEGFQITFFCSHRKTVLANGKEFM